MKTVHVSELDALSLPQFGFLWRPVRATLGVEGFGVNAYTAREPGGELIEDHDETGGGAGRHQELYVVLSGHAVFTIDGQTVEAPTGTLVFCDEPNRYCGEVNGVLDNHIRAVEQRIEELAHLAKELRQLRAVCRAPGTADKCRILQNLRGSSASLPAAARKGRKPSRA